MIIILVIHQFIKSNQILRILLLVSKIFRHEFYRKFKFSNSKAFEKKKHALIIGNDIGVLPVALKHLKMGTYKANVLG